MKNFEEISIKYFQGKSTDEEKEQLLIWLKENKESRKKFFQDKDIWDSGKLDSKALKEDEIAQWLLLEEKIKGRKISTFKIKEFIKIAAVIIVTLGIGWMGHYMYSSSNIFSDKAEMKQVRATKGQVTEVYLADGTHVWLNSDSKLSFPSKFNSRNRKIELEGEAYFEVTANERKPFFVNTKNHTVKVTGTQFNICEYPESKIIETTLVEGKVKIISENFMNNLFPGQKSSFNTETAIARISKVDFEIYTAWKDGRYEFKNEPIEKVFEIVERWWDVEINYPESKFKNERISGVLKRHKPLEQHFEVIKQLIPINYEIVNDVINVKITNN